MGKNITGNDLYFGYCVDLMEKISSMLNISYELRHVKDNKFGAKGFFYATNKILFSIILFIIIINSVR